MDALIQKLESLNTATKTTVNFLTTLFTKTTFKKGWMFGNGVWQSTPMLFYISNGLVKGSVEYKGASYTLWMLENGFLIPSNGFLSQKGLLETIEFLKPTQAYALNLIRAEKLAKENTNLYKMLLEIYEENLLDGRQRELMLRIPNAADRLNYFTALNPNLKKNITDEYMAQLLRIDRKYYYNIKKSAPKD